MHLECVLCWAVKCWPKYKPTLYGPKALPSFLWKDTTRGAQ